MYATANLQNRYRNDAITTAGPVDLIIMLYDGCIRQIKRACLFLEEKDYENGSAAIEKAQDILEELARSLDMKYPISENLQQLYQFAYFELVQVYATEDVKRAQPVLDMLAELRDAWREVKTKTGKFYHENED